MKNKALRVQGIKLAVISIFALALLVFCGGSLFDKTAEARTKAAKAPEVAPAAPTGIEASDNDYYDKVGIHWDTIKGATLYRIFRNRSNAPSSAVDVGTTAANYFFDTTGAQGTSYFYWVRAENASGVSDLGAPERGIRALGALEPGAQILPLNPPVAPTGNDITAAKSSLGKALFWDEQLSSTRTVSCGTCHRSSAGGSDPRTAVNNPASTNPGFDNTFGTADDIFGSAGVPMNNADGSYSMSALYGFKPQVTGRKAPSYLNAGYARNGLFWDGRALDVFRDPLTNAIVLGSRAGLESQVLGPPLNTGEMGHAGRDWTQVATRIAGARPLAAATNVPSGLKAWIDGRTYPQLFEEAFGTPDVTPSRIAMAIATHERTLFSDRTPLDRSIAIEPLLQLEAEGKDLFAALRCNICHTGNLLTDNSFHNIGVSAQAADPGRFAVTNNENDRGRFKTPNLRNLELRGPYMHNGRFQTIEEVIEFYNRGGDFDAPNLDTQIQPLGLTTAEKAALAAYLKRPLTDLRVTNELPPFDRPKLFTESIFVPQVSGSGRAGTGGISPEVTAIEPPFVGNPGFTVAVSKGLGNTTAVLVISSADPGVGAAIPASGSFLRQSVTLSGTGAGNGYGSITMPIPNNPALAGQVLFGRWYITDAGAANGFSASRLFQFTIYGESVLAQGVKADFDGDRKTDVSIFRPSTGLWKYLRSASQQLGTAVFGAGTDKLVPADFTGDGKSEIAVWRPSDGNWYMLRSDDGTFYSFPYGQSGDVPVPADYDGDAKADCAVFRPSNGTWFIQASTRGFMAMPFGQNGDIPQVGDYDHDGKADFAVFRPNGVTAEWWISRTSTGAFSVVQFGLSTDKPVADDFTGDGKFDIAVWRPTDGNWYMLQSEDGNYTGMTFGTPGDQPAHGDYDGDGKADIGVFRPSDGNFYVNRSSQGFYSVNIGTNGDKAVPGAFTP